MSEQKTNNKELNIIEYSEKSFVVFGSDTKTYREQLKSLGGRFNGHLKERENFPGGPAWIFPNKHYDNVKDFVESVKSGNFQTGEIPTNEEQGAMLPSVIEPIQNQNKYQMIKWKVFKPKESMTVTIKSQGKTIDAKIKSIETHNDIVDTVYISVNNGTSKLVICNGQWQVWGYMTKHKIRFNEKN